MENIHSQFSEQTLIIDLSELDKGVYFARVISDEETFVSRVVYAD